MTPLDKVFMLSSEARLTRETLQQVLASGHSRIPVYQAPDRCNIVGLILVKELLQYRAADEVAVKAVRMRSLPR
jgi:metal transporter CNNM